MKLAINLPLAGFWQTTGEAYALCRHLGRDSVRLVELFADTSGGPDVLKAPGAAIAAALSAGEPSSATFDCDSIRKDLSTMVAEAHTRASRCRWPNAPSRCTTKGAAKAGRTGLHTVAGLLRGPEQLMSEMDAHRV